MENINILQIPHQEWADVKAQLASISKAVIEINNKNKPEFLTPKQCCELLNCSRNTYQSYVDKGFLTAVKMKSEKYSKVLIKRSDIDYFIENTLQRG
ncbi:MAG: helix-turn-helix domain-containing protein [Sphingobacteriaceae bacterium]|nr:helix-turn-helix domain-containing protein [Sphingobacteriaceae bacterium]